MSENTPTALDVEAMASEIAHSFWRGDNMRRPHAAVIADALAPLAAQLSAMESAKNAAESEVAKLSNYRAIAAHTEECLVDMGHRAEAAKIEVARLREALKVVANKIEAYLANIDTPDDFIIDAAKDARAALAQSPEPQ